MTRAEELALIHAVLVIGIKVSAMKPDPLYVRREDVVGSEMFYTTDKQMELTSALIPLRQILDKAERKRKR